MKIAIIGYNIEGQASYDFFAAQDGNEIVIHDQNPDTDIPAGIPSVLGPAYLDGLETYDLIVRTAGLPPHLILERNPDVADKITSHINEFFRACPTKNIIGVTGTKGKGTTTTLISRMLEAAGKSVHTGGNIGLPPLTFINELREDSWVVLELSSFQLMDIQFSPHIGVCLMVVPEHLNWHKDMDEYARAKSNMFAYQTPEDIAIYFGPNNYSKRIATTGSAAAIPYYATPGAIVENDSIVIDGQHICDTSELKLLGEHNWQNACAAVTAVWQVVQDRDAIRSVLTTFSGLEHRLEFVREVDEVKYYDDSFGTTPETAIVALQAFDQPKIAILGGSDKGASYDELAKVVAENNVRKVLLIGGQAGRIQSALEAAGFKDFMPGGSNMTEIITAARSVAQPGDVVLLSTACASFGMFQNYKDRGNQFKTAVQALA